MRFGGTRILRGDRRDEGFVWLLTGVALFGTLVWAFPRVVKGRKPKQIAAVP